MSFTPAPPMPTGAPKTGGVSCYLRPTKRGLTFTLYFSAGAQEQVFGGSIVGRRFLLGIGRGSDEGKLQIMAVPDDSETAASAFVAGGGVRGGGVDQVRRLGSPAEGQAAGFRSQASDLRRTAGAADVAELGAALETRWSARRGICAEAGAARRNSGTGAASAHRARRSCRSDRRTGGGHGPCGTAVIT